MERSEFFDQETVDDVTVITLDGKEVLDREKLSELREAISSLVDQEHPHKLLVDFGGVQYCTSEFIGVLIRAHRRLAQDNGRIDLCNLQPTIHEVFKTLNLDGTMFRIHDTRGTALTELQQC
ncbi:MAG: STAS domain-containing protein [Planctomycetales bacterium]|nr:STAS domain-containing protein [Planctomycetales bacterium]